MRLAISLARHGFADFRNSRGDEALTSFSDHATNCRNGNLLAAFIMINFSA